MKIISTFSLGKLYIALENRTDYSIMEMLGLFV